MSREVAIIGGGIAGLTTAISLTQKGFSPIVFESASELRPVGAGLALAANAMMAYERLGLADKVAAAGRRIPAFSILDERGGAISETVPVFSENTSQSNYAIHRADLHALLASELNKENLILNKKSVSYEQKGGRVVVHFEDGTSHECDQLIVAEGIHSPLRKQVLPNSKPRYAGYTCWRGVITNPGLDLDRSTETWGKGKRFGIVPLSNNHIYWFACINGPQNSEQFRNFTVTDLQKAFASFHHPVSTILEHTKNEDLIWSDIVDLKPINQFAFDNVALIGDAAHATTPNMGQGACQAIEDAIVLADEMSKKAEISEAFKAFEKRRLERTHSIVKRSWTIGKIGQLENPILIALRNTLFRLIPESASKKQMAFLYAVDF